MTLILRNRNLTFLILSRFISRLGDWVLDIALPIKVYALTGSATALGTIIILEIIPGILLAPLIGLTIDRANQKLILVFANLFLGLSVMLLLFLGSHTVELVYVVALCNAVIGAFVAPTHASLLPSIVEPDRLIRANSIVTTVVQSTLFFGPVFAAGAMAWSTFEGLVILDAITFGVASVLALAMTVPNGVGQSNDAKMRSVFEASMDGFRLIIGQKLLRAIVIMGITMMVSAGIVATVLLVFIKTVLMGTDANYAHLLSIQGFGMIVGGVVAMTILHKSEPGKLFTFASVIFAALFLLGASTLSITIAGVAVFGMGICIAVVTISNQTLLQTIVAQDIRGRVFATIDALSSAALLGGAALAGFATDILGVRPVFIGGALIALLGSFGPILYRVHTVEMESIPREEIEESRVRS